MGLFFNFIIKLPPFLTLWPIVVLVARQATREASLTYVHIIIQRVCMQKFNSSFILHSYLFNGSNRVINMLFQISTRVLCLDVYILTKFHQHSFFYLWLLTEIYWLKGSDSHKIQCVIVYVYCWNFVKKYTWITYFLRAYLFMCSKYQYAYR